MNGAAGRLAPVRVDVDFLCRASEPAIRARRAAA